LFFIQFNIHRIQVVKSNKNVNELHLVHKNKIITLNPGARKSFKDLKNTQQKKVLSNLFQNIQQALDVEARELAKGMLSIRKIKETQQDVNKETEAKVENRETNIKRIINGKRQSHVEWRTGITNKFISTC
jgi:hypothetical protein